MSDVDFRLLQGAITLAEELNMSRAAERLGITQPALTKRMHELEDRLGLPLFERTNRGVELTEHCRAFIEEARLAMLQLDRAVQKARASAGGSEDVLHIGRSPYVNPYLVSILSSTRLPLYPKLRLEFSGNFSSELARQVTAHELDLALIAKGGESSYLNYLVVDTAPFYVLFRQIEPRLSSFRTLSLQELDHQPWALFGRHVHPYLHDQLLLAAKETGVSSPSIRSIQTAEEGAQLVSQFGGVAFLTPIGAWRAMAPGLTIRPLTGERLRLLTVLVTRRGDESRLLSEYVRSTMKKLEKPPSAQRTLSFAG